MTEGTLSPPHFVPTGGTGEARARMVTAMTIAMMFGELAVGWWSGSLALLADGWHMATHAGALGLASAAYWYAREHAHSGRYTFGTGKVYALAGFASAIGLGCVAVGMSIESVERLFSPVAIAFDEALPIAVLGLAVNLVSALMLKDDHAGHDHGPHDHDHDHGEPGASAAHDHNLRAAYVHVLADALTSVLAIGALVAGRQLGWTFLDPVTGLVGAAVILRWSIGLARESAQPLLDEVPDGPLVDRIRRRIESIDDARVIDLHFWQTGPGHCACILSVAAARPLPIAVYRSAVLEVAPIDHLTIELHALEAASG